VIPLEVFSDVTGMGRAESVGSLTLAVFPPPAARPNRFEHAFYWGEEPGVEPTLLGLEASGAGLEVTLAGRPQPYPGVILRVQGRRASSGRASYGETEVPLEALDVDACWSAEGPAFHVDQDAGVTWVRAPATRGTIGLRSVDLVD
jgi:hypothetical protein